MLCHYSQSVFIIPNRSSVPPPCPQAPLTNRPSLSVSVGFPSPGPSSTWNHTALSFVPALSPRHVSEAHPRRGLCQNPLPFRGRMIFHDTGRPHPASPSGSAGNPVSNHFTSPPSAHRGCRFPTPSPTLVVFRSGGNGRLGDVRGRVGASATGSG